MWVEKINATAYGRQEETGESVLKCFLRWKGDVNIFIVSRCPWLPLAYRFGESVHLDLLTVFLRGFSRSAALRGCKLPSTPSGVSPRDPRVKFGRYSYRCNGVWGVPKRGTGEAPGMDNIYFYQCRQASEPKASGVIVDIDFNKKWIWSNPIFVLEQSLILRTHVIDHTIKNSIMKGKKILG